MEWDNLYNIGSSQEMITVIIYMISKHNVKDVNASDIYKQASSIFLHVGHFPSLKALFAPKPLSHFQKRFSAVLEWRNWVRRGRSMAVAVHRTPQILHFMGVGLIAAQAAWMPCPSSQCQWHSGWLTRELVFANSPMSSVLGRRPSCTL